MVGGHHQLNGQEFEQTPGDGEGQGSRTCCSPWGRKQSDMPEQLNNNKAIQQNTTRPQTAMSFVAELYSSMLGQPQNHYAKEKKSDTKEYNPYDFIYTKGNLI